MDTFNNLIEDDNIVQAGDRIVWESPQALKSGSSATTRIRFSESRFQLHESAVKAGSLSQASGSSPGLGTRPGPNNNHARPRTLSRYSQAKGAAGETSTSHSTGLSHSTCSPNSAAPVESTYRLSTDSPAAAMMGSRTTATPSKTSRAVQPSRPIMHNSDAMTPHKESSGDKVATSLLDLAKELDQNHAKLVYFSLKTATQPKRPESRHLSATADLADLKMSTLPFDTKRQNVMRVQLKGHREKDPSRAAAGKKKMAYEVTCIKSNKQRVPKYRFHHVEISRNILSPNTSLKFIPHLKDMKEGEEERYRRWIKELETMDVQSGFNATSSNRAEKAAKMLQEEMAIELSFYIDHWITKLDLENCTKASLVRYMATQSEDDDKMTPQQKTSIVNKLSDDLASPGAIRAARIFTDAFNSLWKRTGVTLKDVLVFDETVEAVVENKKMAKDGKSEPEKKGIQQLLDAAENRLATYTILGCLYCYSHSCEHGEHDSDNIRRPIGVATIGSFGGLVRQNLALSLANATEDEDLDMADDPKATEKPKEPPITPCANRCYLLFQTGPIAAKLDPWSEEDLAQLQGFYIALAGRKRLLAPCVAAAFIGRYCWEIHRKALELHLGKEELEKLAGSMDDVQQPVKSLPWYDRFKKELKADWQEQCYSHRFTLRQVTDPCSHAGPCEKGCPCFDAKLLCERFCRCTVDNCARKYTGCACHMHGKTCLQQQKTTGRPCICVQLSRECDPVLCTGCGALERADPKNAHNLALHAIGCQNVPLQRGVAKAVLLGESQIEGCGYGLFAAEEISQDEFVIEYVGELISHDEGVRREARRGNVFDESKHSSYLFTLLDYEGIWVDGAIYGNLSRYINHASETDKVGRKLVNMVPQIHYVNGDFRIKFRALRDIKVGEELFFNYGENFPNLTKNLLDWKDGEGSRPKRGRRGGGRGSRGGGRGRGSRGRGGRGGGIKFGTETKKAPAAIMEEDEGGQDTVRSDSEVEEPIFDDDDDDDDDDYVFTLNPPTRSKIRTGRGASATTGRSSRGGHKRKRETDHEADSTNQPPPPRIRGTRASSVVRGRGRGRAARGRRGSHRGGARLANGGSVATAAAFRPDSDDDDDDVYEFKPSAAPSDQHRHNLRLRRRARLRIPDSDEDEVDDSSEDGTYQNAREGTDGLDESSTTGRARRRRQRPARYRDQEE